MVVRTSVPGNVLVEGLAACGVKARTAREKQLLVELCDSAGSGDLTTVCDRDVPELVERGARELHDLRRISILPEVRKEGIFRHEVINLMRNMSEMRCPPEIKKQVVKALPELVDRYKPPLTNKFHADDILKIQARMDELSDETFLEYQRERFEMTDPEWKRHVIADIRVPPAEFWTLKTKMQLPDPPPSLMKTTLTPKYPNSLGAFYLTRCKNEPPKRETLWEKRAHSAPRLSRTWPEPEPWPKASTSTMKVVGRNEPGQGPIALPRRLRKLPKTREELPHIEIAKPSGLLTVPEPSLKEVQQARMVAANREILRLQHQFVASQMGIRCQTSENRRMDAKAVREALQVEHDRMQQREDRKNLNFVTMASAPVLSPTPR